MLAKAPLVVIPDLSPETYAAHALHAQDRDWPETNCYIDVWVEILHALRLEPRAVLGFTVAQDFEGDHFTFGKCPLEDLRSLYGLETQELALYDTLESHILEQTARGRMVIVEVDAFFLPSTRGVSYGLDHTKTTIAINRVDAHRRTLEYFHGAGFHQLAGADYDAIMRQGRDGLFPYAEFVKLDRRHDADRDAAFDLLRAHLHRRPALNPLLSFRDRLPEQIAFVAARPESFLHKYAFNTARQLGANFELLATHLAWLDAPRGSGFARSIDLSRALSAAAKVFQFQLARAVARKRFDMVDTLATPLVTLYDEVFAHLVPA